MLADEEQNTSAMIDAEKSEFYRLIGEGYTAIKDGRISTIHEVREKID